MNRAQINRRNKQINIILKMIRVIRFIAGMVAGFAAFAVYGTVGSIDRGLHLDIADRNLLIFGCIFAVSFFVWYECGGKYELEK